VCLDEAMETTTQRIARLMEATGTTDPFEIAATLFDEDVAEFGPQHPDLHGDYFAAAVEAVAP
jgi:hypothetical protein